MFNKTLAKVFGTSNDRAVKRMLPVLTQINDFEPAIQQLSDEELAAKTTEFRARIAAAIENITDEEQRTAAEKQALDDLLPEAFAVVRESGRRIVGMRHFDVQMIGGMALHQGKIAEMKTGEGKTLVATLPCYLNALAGHGVHVVTVNDYLAKRDADGWVRSTASSASPSASSSTISPTPSAAPPTAPTSPTAPTTSSASTTSATT